MFFSLFSEGIVIKGYVVQSSRRKTSTVQFNFNTITLSERSKFGANRLLLASDGIKFAVLPFLRLLAGNSFVVRCHATDSYLKEPNERAHLVLTKLFIYLQHGLLPKHPGHTDSRDAVMCVGSSLTPRLLQAAEKYLQAGYYSLEQVLYVWFFTIIQ